MFVSSDTNHGGARSTVEARVNSLLTGQAQYSLTDAAERAGMDQGLARMFWLAMGFPDIADEVNDVIFTGYDVSVMRRHADKLAAGELDSKTLNSLVRAQSYMADRLVLWQLEALVEFAQNTFELDDVAARYWLLDHIDEYLPFLEDQLKYAWRRHMAGFLRRSEVEADRRALDSDNESMPLNRAIGFVDLVSFTPRSSELGSKQLVSFVRNFEFACRDVISSNGARLVKTVGDAVLYVADSVEVGARVATELVATLGEIDGMLPVKSAVVWGGVVSAFGDVFGPNVNLASRLADAAPTGSILIDRETVVELNKSPQSRRYTISPYGEQHLDGVGQVETFELWKRH